MPLFRKEGPPEKILPSLSLPQKVAGGINIKGPTIAPATYKRPDEANVHGSPPQRHIEPIHAQFPYLLFRETLATTFPEWENIPELHKLHDAIEILRKFDNALKIPGEGATEDLRDVLLSISQPSDALLWQQLLKVRERRASYLDFFLTTLINKLPDQQPILNQFCSYIEPIVTTACRHTQRQKILLPSLTNSLFERIEKNSQTGVIKSTNVSGIWGLLRWLDIGKPEEKLIMSVLQNLGDFEHPLAYELYVSLLEDNEFRTNQENLIYSLVQACTGTTDEVLERAEEIEKLVSQIVLLLPSLSGRLGLDTEIVPRLLQPCPFGIDPGLDGGETMPEYRLNKDHLFYGTDWLRRYLEFAKMAELSLSDLISVHFHLDCAGDSIELKDNDNEWLLSRLFGSTDDVKPTEFSTIEVRTALCDYPYYMRERGRGFQFIDIIPLMELGLSLVNGNNPLGVEEMVAFTTSSLLSTNSMWERWCQVISDPITRAGLAIVLSRGSHARLNTGNASFSSDHNDDTSMLQVVASTPSIESWKKSLKKLSLTCHSSDETISILSKAMNEVLRLLAFALNPNKLSEYLALVQEIVDTAINVFPSYYTEIVEFAFSRIKNAKMNVQLCSDTTSINIINTCVKFEKTNDLKTLISLLSTFSPEFIIGLSEETKCSIIDHVLLNNSRDVLSNIPVQFFDVFLVLVSSSSTMWTNIYDMLVVFRKTNKYWMNHLLREHNMIQPAVRMAVDKNPDILGYEDFFSLSLIYIQSSISTEDGCRVMLGEQGYGIFIEKYSENLLNTFKVSPTKNDVSSVNITNLHLLNESIVNGILSALFSKLDHEQLANYKITKLLKFCGNILFSSRLDISPSVTLYEKILDSLTDDDFTEEIVHFLILTIRSLTNSEKRKILVGKIASLTNSNRFQLFLPSFAASTPESFAFLNEIVAQLDFSSIQVIVSLLYFIKMVGPNLSPESIAKLVKSATENKDPSFLKETILILLASNHSTKSQIHRVFDLIFQSRNRLTAGLIVHLGSHHFEHKECVKKALIFDPDLFVEYYKHLSKFAAHNLLSIEEEQQLLNQALKKHPKPLELFDSILTEVLKQTSNRERNIIFSRLFISEIYSSLDTIGSPSFEKIRTIVGYVNNLLQSNQLTDEDSNNVIHLIHDCCLINQEQGSTNNNPGIVRLIPSLQPFVGNQHLPQITMSFSR